MKYQKHREFAIKMLAEKKHMDPGEVSGNKTRLINRMGGYQLVSIDLDFCQSLPMKDDAEFGYQLMHRVGGRSVVDKRGNEYLNYTRIARGMTVDLFLEIYYETQGGV